MLQRSGKCLLSRSDLPILRHAKSRPYVGYFVNCWSVALVNAKRLRRSLTVLQTTNTFCDVPSNADLSISCAAEQLLV